MRMAVVRGLVLGLATGMLLAAGPARGESAPIRLGHYGSMSGSKTAFGESTDRGIRLAVVEANRTGGVLGRRVEVVTADDLSSTDQVLPAVMDLVDRRRVDVVLGEVASTLTLIGAPFCQERGVPMITPSSVAAAITRTGPWIFRVCFTAEYQGRAAAIFAARDLKARRAALLVDQGSDYALGYAQAFAPLFEQLGGEIVGSWSYRDGDQDFKAQLTAVAGARPDVLVVPAMYHDVPGIARQSRQVGLAAPLLGGDGWDAIETARIGGKAVEGSYFTTHYAPDQPGDRVRAFQDAFRHAYGSPPDAIAALGYDAARLALDAIARAGTTDREAVRAALASTRDFPGVTGTITMGAGRDPAKSVMVLQIRDGGFHLHRMIEPAAIRGAGGSGRGPAGRGRIALPTTTFVLQQLINGIGLGVIYGLIAVGYTIVYGILRLINFAHGDVFMLGPVFVVGLAAPLGLAGWPWPASAIGTFALAMALCGGVGLGLERVAYRPLRRPYGWRTIATVLVVVPTVLLVAGEVAGPRWPDARVTMRIGAIGAALYAVALASNRLAARLDASAPSRMVPLITAIGASLFLESATQQPALFGSRPREFPIRLAGADPIRLGGLHLDRGDLLALAVTLVLLLLLTWIVRRTRLGLAMRAVSSQPDAALLMGVNLDAVIAGSFLLGGAMAGAAGVLWAAKYPVVDPLMGLMPGLKAFVAAVLGGVGSLPGAVLGGLVMGISEAFLAASPLSPYKDALAFVLLIAVLLVRPAGLLGKHLPEKV